MHSMRQNTVRQRLGPLTLERFARICILCGKIQCGSVLSHWGPQPLSSETLADAFYTAKYSAAAPVALLSHWGPHSLCSEMLIFAFYTAKYSAAAPVGAPLSTVSASFSANVWPRLHSARQGTVRQRLRHCLPHGSSRIMALYRASGSFCT